MPSWPIWAAVGLYGAWQAAQVYRTWRRERALTAARSMEQQHDGGGRSGD